MSTEKRPSAPATDTSQRQPTIVPAPTLTPAERKQRIQTTFNTVAGGYDTEGLWFFPASATAIVDYFELRGDENILDVATGTGWAALALAAAVPRGLVTGIDLSIGMLQQARTKAQARGLRNVEFRQVDIDELAAAFPARHFAAANCSFAIFFMEDMTAAMRNIAHCVKPGGTITITGFAAGAFLPHSDLFMDCLERHGIPRIQPGFVRSDTEEKTRALFTDAGLTDIRTIRRDLSRDIDCHGWWEIVWNAGYRGLLNSLTPAQLEEFRREHLAEIQTLIDAGCPRLEVGVLDTVGKVA